MVRECGRARLQALCRRRSTSASARVPSPRGKHGPTSASQPSSLALYFGESCVPVSQKRHSDLFPRSIEGPGRLQYGRENAVHATRTGLPCEAVQRGLTAIACQAVSHSRRTKQESHRFSQGMSVALFHEETAFLLFYEFWHACHLGGHPRHLAHHSLAQDVRKPVPAPD